MYLRTNEGLGEAPAPATMPVIQSPMVRVTNARVAPYRCVCRIVARSYDERGLSIGTGFLISPYHVLTCAHNIYPIQAPRTKTIDVYPAQNGPDDHAVRFPANGWAVSARWRPNDCRTAPDDYGIIRLASPTQYGFFQLRPFDPAILPGRTVHLAGYPFDREPRARHMYRSAGPVIGAVVIEGCGKDTLQRRIFPSISSTTSFIAHALATGRAVSGSPMWFEEGGSRTIIGLHERAIDNNRRGAGVLLNDAVRAQVAQWMDRALPPLRR